MEHIPPITRMQERMATMRLPVRTTAEPTVTDVVSMGLMAERHTEPPTTHTQELMRAAPPPTDHTAVDQQRKLTTHIPEPTHAADPCLRPTEPDQQDKPITRTREHLQPHDRARMLIP